MVHSWHLGYHMVKVVTGAPVDLPAPDPQVFPFQAVIPLPAQVIKRQVPSLRIKVPGY